MVKNPKIKRGDPRAGRKEEAEDQINEEIHEIVKLWRLIAGWLSPQRLKLIYLFLFNVTKNKIMYYLSIKQFI